MNVSGADLLPFFDAVANHEEGSMEWFNYTAGLCNNCSHFIRGAVMPINAGVSSRLLITSAVKRFLVRYFETWDNYSGNSEYPIVVGDDPVQDYEEPGVWGMYAGEYGEQRRDLARHIAAEIRKNPHRLL